MQREGGDFFKAKKWHGQTRIDTKQDTSRCFSQVQFWFFDGPIN